MKRVVFLLLLFHFTLQASFMELEGEDIYKIKVLNTDFDQLFVNIKDEILNAGFTIVHQIDLAKSTNGVAKSMKKQEVLEHGKVLMICKSSFALRMLEENIDNITYCPMAISIYADKAINYISFRKYKSFLVKDKIAKEINNTLKDLILRSLE